jgi:hypothetical protein
MAKPGSVRWTDPAGETVEGAPMEVTLEEWARAEREGGASLKRLGTQIGCHSNSVVFRIDPERKESKRQQNAQRKAGRGGDGTAGNAGTRERGNGERERPDDGLESPSHPEGRSRRREREGTRVPISTEREAEEATEKRRDDGLESPSHPEARPTGGITLEEKLRALGLDLTILQVEQMRKGQLRWGDRDLATVDLLKEAREETADLLNYAGLAQSCGQLGTEAYGKLADHVEAIWGILTGQGE